MKPCIIIGGAEINNYEAIKKVIGKHPYNEHYCIFCDSGLKHMEGLGLKPDLIVGDFDSCTPSDFKKIPMEKTEIITLPREKDDTDTMFGIKEGIRRGFDNFLLLGVVGERLDHSLVNVYALLMLDSLGKKGIIVDNYSEMEIVSKKPAFITDDYSYFSLLNISGMARDVTITNAKFPMEHGEITNEYQFATSNEVLPGKTAEVTVGLGRLLLIKIF